ncbi:MAG TPA: hypothetical protein VGK26_13750, partial [Thermoanaerobaculia bacterium]
GLDLAPKDLKDRAHPEPGVAKRYESIWPAARAYVDRELTSPEDRIGATPADLARFFAEHETEVDRIAGRLEGRGEAIWDMDVREGRDSPFPNLFGHVQLMGLLGARLLLLERRGEHDAVLQGLEGMWKLAESLASRPEIISHVILLQETRCVVGILRKVDAPALEWVERMRGRGFFEACLAACQNEGWHRGRDRPEQAAAISRVALRFTDGLLEKGPCVWSRDELAHRLEVAASAEEPEYEAIAADALGSFVDVLSRWYRLLLDEELTALVLEARGERAASRDRTWPAQLPRLDSEVCSEERWSYKRAANGSAALSYEGHAPDSDARGLVLPLSFRALPPPTPTPTPTRPTLTPTATAHTLTHE